MEKLNLEKGMRVIVNLVDDQCFLGNILRIGQHFGSISLENVEDVYSGKPVTSIQIFYKSEIKFVKIVKRKTNKDENEENNELESSLNETDEIENKDSLNISVDDIKNIQEMINGAKYINQTDVNYHTAVKNIKEQEIIGLAILGDEKCRYSHTSIISISTKEKIYLFDIFALGKVFRELKEILEGRVPRKIVYNSSRAADNLKYKQAVHLNSIFDIMVAHASLGYEKKSINLAECILIHFNLPLQECPEINWNSRPISDANKGIAAQNVAYLHKLYSYFLHEKMLKSFYQSCRQFADSYRKNIDDGEVALELVSEEKKNLNSVESFKLDTSDISPDPSS